MAEIDFASAREIHHFNHTHILKLTTFHGRETFEKYCSGCMKPIGGGLAYHCPPCNFLLHLTCSQIPHKITHPADTHLLHLLPQPCNYGPSSTACRCNACWEPIIHGYSFHCSICRLDLHPSCANLPRRIKDPNHAHNSLDLYFVPPYPSKAFTCNVCMKEDQRSWSYHCFECNYDSHVNCTQIPSLRESLLNKTSEAINRAYADYTSSGHRHLDRRFSEPPRLSSFPRPSSLHSWSPFQMQQQQYRPYFQNPNNTMGNMFVRPAITAIMQTLLGSIAQSFINPGSGNFSDVTESLFNFGFF